MFCWNMSSFRDQSNASLKKTQLVKLDNAPCLSRSQPTIFRRLDVRAGSESDSCTFSGVMVETAERKSTIRSRTLPRVSQGCDLFHVSQFSIGPRGKQKDAVECMNREETGAAKTFEIFTQLRFIRLGVYDAFSLFIQKAFVVAHCFLRRSYSDSSNPRAWDSHGHFAVQSSCDQHL